MGFGASRCIPGPTERRIGTGGSRPPPARRSGTAGSRHAVPVCSGGGPGPARPQALLPARRPVGSDPLCPQPLPSRPAEAPGGSVGLEEGTRGSGIAPTPGAGERTEGPGPEGELRAAGTPQRIWGEGCACGRAGRGGDSDESQRRAPLLARPAPNPPLPQPRSPPAHLNVPPTPPSLGRVLRSHGRRRGLTCWTAVWVSPFPPQG